MDWPALCGGLVAGGECWKPKKRKILGFSAEAQKFSGGSWTHTFLQTLDSLCSNGSVQRVLHGEGRRGGGAESHPVPLKENELADSVRRFRRGYTGPRGLCIVLGQQVPHESNSGALHFGGGMWNMSGSINRLEPSRAEQTRWSTVPTGLYPPLPRSPGCSSDPAWLQNPGITMYISHLIRV